MTLVEWANRESKNTDVKRPLEQQVALVTGAGSGIGKAVAEALGGNGARLYAVGRNANALDELASRLHSQTDVQSLPLDLTVDGSVAAIQASLNDPGRLDILVHCAGVIHPATMQ